MQIGRLRHKFLELAGAEAVAAFDATIDDHKEEEAEEAEEEKEEEAVAEAHLPHTRAALCAAYRQSAPDVRARIRACDEGAYKELHLSMMLLEVLQPRRHTPELLRSEEEDLERLRLDFQRVVGMVMSAFTYRTRQATGAITEAQADALIAARMEKEEEPQEEEVDVHIRTAVTHAVHRFFSRVVRHDHDHDHDDLLRLEPTHRQRLLDLGLRLERMVALNREAHGVATLNRLIEAMAHPYADPPMTTAVVVSDTSFIRAAAETVGIVVAVVDVVDADPAVVVEPAPPVNPMAWSVGGSVVEAGD